MSWILDPDSGKLTCYNFPTECPGCETVGVDINIPTKAKYDNWACSRSVLNSDGDQDECGADPIAWACSCGTASCYKHNQAFILTGEWNNYY